MAEVNAGFAGWSAVEPSLESTGQLAAVQIHQGAAELMSAHTVWAPCSCLFCPIYRSSPKLNAVLISTWVLKPVSSQLQVVFPVIFNHASWGKSRFANESVSSLKAPHFPLLLLPQVSILQTGLRELYYNEWFYIQMVYWAWFVLYILEYDLTYFYCPFSSFFHEEKTETPTLSQCEVPLCLCVVCQANTQQPQDFSPSLLVSNFTFHCHLVLSEALLRLPLLSSLLHSLHREGRGQYRQDSFPFPLLACFTYPSTKGLSSSLLGAVWLRVNKYKRSPTRLPSSMMCRSNRFSFSESDCGWSHSIGLNVYGLHLFFLLHFRNLKTRRNDRQLFNLSQVTLKALYIYL